MSPWQVAHSTFGADVRRVVEAHVRLAREPVDALPRNLDPLLRIAGDLLDQRLVGRDRLWQIMQVLTLGIPAIGPLSTLSWQSAQTAFFAMWVLCGNGIGCTAVGRIAEEVARRFARASGARA